jgi:hypothetical protein
MNKSYDEILRIRMNDSVKRQWEKQNEEAILLAEAERAVQREREEKAKKAWQLKIKAEQDKIQGDLDAKEAQRIEAAIANELAKEYHKWRVEHPTQANHEIVWENVVKPNIKALLTMQLKEREKRERYEAYRAANPTLSL